MDYIIGFLLAVTGVLVYFLPAIIAYMRNHHNWVPILLVNFFTGWFVLGWIIALVWSTTAVKAKPVAAAPFNDSATPSASLKQRLEELRGFYESGLINEDEYSQKKAELLSDMK